MKPEELREILNQREGPKLDFKREYKIYNAPMSVVAKQEWDKLRKGQWDELIKDILSLTNGNTTPDTIGQRGLLIIGADDDLLPGGSRPLHDVSHLELTAKQILDKVNNACEPRLTDLDCELIEIDGKKLYVISIPETYSVHKTTRVLNTKTGAIDESGHVKLTGEKDYRADSYLMRVGESVRYALDPEIHVLEELKSAKRASLYDVPSPLYQLPPDLPDFVGRDGEIAAIEEYVLRLRDSPVNIAIVGMGGVGKSKLAIHIAHRLKDRFPDAQLYLNLRGSSKSPISSTESLSGLLRAFYPSEILPESENELVALFRSTLHNKHTLLLLDDAKDVAQIKKLLTGELGCMTLITSRYSAFAPPRFQLIKLKVLTLSEACALLLSTCPRLRSGLPTRFSVTDMEKGTADQIAELCGNLPLAVRLAGSTLAVRTDLAIADYVRRLSISGKRLKSIDLSLDSTDEAFGVEESFKLSYELLTSQQRFLWSLLPVFPASFDREAASAIWKLPQESAQDILSALVKYSLVELQPSPFRRRDTGEAMVRYRLHDLAQLWADACLEPHFRNDAQRTHAEHYLDLLRRTEKYYLRDRRWLTYGLVQLDLEWANIQAGQAWAAAHFRENELAAGLCSAYARFGTNLLSLRQRPREQIRWLESALDAAQSMKDIGAESIHLSNLGNAYSAMGDYHQAVALHQQALAISRRIGNQQVEVLTLHKLGRAYASLGEDYQGEARDCFIQQLTLAHERGDKKNEQEALEALGDFELGLKYPYEAIKYYEQSLALAHKAGDGDGEHDALLSLGNCYAVLEKVYRSLYLIDATEDMEKPRSAVEFYEQAYKVAKENHDRRRVGRTLGNLGDYYLELGQDKQFADLHRRVKLAGRSMDDFEWVSSQYARISAGMEEKRQAINCYEQALSIVRQIGDIFNESLWVFKLGQAYVDIGKKHQAIACFDQALSIDHDIGNQLHEIEDLTHLGKVYVALGEMLKAIDYYKQALDIARHVGNVHQEREILNYLGNCWAEQGDHTQAIDHYEHVLVIDRESDDSMQLRGAYTLWRSASSWPSRGIVYEPSSMQRSLSGYMTMPGLLL